MSTSSIRVLVVDDYEPWRRFVLSALREQPQLQVVGQVSDGLEAVQNAERLQPDLIVLDIGLPILNGIEAAGRIRNVSPASKILFASENRSPDIVEEALIRGMGYLSKSDAGHELLSAIEAVLEGKRFVSASLAGLQVSTPNDPVATHDRRTTVASIAPRTVHHHEVVFYSDDRQLLLWELMRTRREQLTASQLMRKNPTEAIVDTDNHLRGALKYILLSLPRPSEKPRHQTRRDHPRGF